MHPERRLWPIKRREAKTKIATRLVGEKFRPQIVRLLSTYDQFAQTNSPI